MADQNKSREQLSKTLLFYGQWESADGNFWRLCDTATNERDVLLSVSPLEGVEHTFRLTTEEAETLAEALAAFLGPPNQRPSS
ncbi:MAG: hypothetical protein N2C14_16450 [Planctomycetales bacterium]